MKTKKGSKTEYLHFKLGEGAGQLVTDIAREKAYQTGNENEAIVFLLDGFQGIDSYQARDIIRGRKKLVETPDGLSVTFEDDDWKPPFDTKMVEHEVNEAVQFCTDLLRPRGSRGPLGGCWYDALPKEQRLDLVVRARDLLKMVKLCPAKALKDAKWLKELAMERMKVNAKRIGDNIRRTRRRSEARHNKKIVEKEPEKRLPDNFDLPTGWLSPDGKWFSCIGMEHISTADTLAHQYNIKGEDLPEKLLEQRGWMKIGTYFTASAQFSLLHTGEKRITKAQLETLWDWYQHHKVKTFEFECKVFNNFQSFIEHLEER